MIIDDFMSRYEREYDYYQESARLCWQRCDIGLIQEGIRAIVTFRVKKPTRLTKKIEQRHPEKRYKCIEDIYNDIVDLAGVRIALYFPGDRSEVHKFLHQQFEIEKVKEKFPPKKNDYYEKRFSGYQATHYHVRLRESYLTEEQKRFSKVCIEVQVASVLMHAWSEVEHDLIYKPLSGELSEDEHAILDEINGLALAGEIALERLQKAVKRRVGKSENRFNNQYELTVYLKDHLQERIQDSPMVIGRADILFRFLQLVDLDRPGKLDKFISELNTTDNQNTISGQIVELILASNPELRKQYEQAKQEVDTRRLNQVSLKFLSQWMALETILRFIAQVKGLKKWMTITPSANTFIQLGLFEENEQILSLIEIIRLARNQLVHGLEVPNSDFFNSASGTIEYIIRNLSDEASEDTRNLISSSKETQTAIARLLKEHFNTQE